MPSVCNCTPAVSSSQQVRLCHIIQDAWMDHSGCLSLPLWYWY